MDAKLTEPNAFSLATVGTDMMPSIRTVLLKSLMKKVLFFTNYKSTKAKQMKKTKSSSTFAWLDLERKENIEGNIKKFQQLIFKIFFHDLKGKSNWSLGFTPKSSYKFKKFTRTKVWWNKKKFVKGEVPFPSFWGGYAIKPTKIEFWQVDKIDFMIDFLWIKRR